MGFNLIVFGNIFKKRGRWKQGRKKKTSVQLKDSMTCPLSLIATMIHLIKMKAETQEILQSHYCHHPKEERHSLGQPQASPCVWKNHNANLVCVDGEIPWGVELEWDQCW